MYNSKKKTKANRKWNIKYYDCIELFSIILMRIKLIQMGMFYYFAFIVRIVPTIRIVPTTYWRKYRHERTMYKENRLYKDLVYIYFAQNLTLGMYYILINTYKFT